MAFPASVVTRVPQLCFFEADTQLQPDMPSPVNPRSLKFQDCKGTCLYHGVHLFSDLSCPDFSQEKSSPSEKGKHSENAHMEPEHADDEGEEGEEEAQDDDDEVDGDDQGFIAEDAAVDPRSQSKLRAKLRAEIKPRGRNAVAKGVVSQKAKAKAKSSPKVKSKAKASPKSRSPKPSTDAEDAAAAPSRKRKQAATLASKDDSIKPKQKAKPKAAGKAKAFPKASPKGKAKAKAKASAAPKRRGKTPVARVPPVSADGVVLSLGCSGCRFAENGCGTCERADFTGRRRSDLTEEELAERMHSHPCYKKKAQKDEIEAPEEDDDQNWEEDEQEAEEEELQEDDEEQEG